MSAFELTRRLAASCLAAIVLCAPLGDAQARDFAASAAETYQRTYTDGALTSDALQQQYGLSYGRTISEPISYFLSLSYEQTNSPLSAPGLGMVTRSVGPLMRVNYTLGDFALNTSYSFHWNETSAGDTTSTQLAHNLTVSAGYRISEHTGVSAVANRVTGISAGTTSTVDRLSESLSYTTEKLAAAQSLLVGHHANGYDRLMVTPGASVSYQNTFYDRKLELTAIDGLSYNWMRERTNMATAAGVDAPRPLSPTAGLYVRADLPNDTSANPMSPLPALIDHDLDASAGVDIGPNGLSFNNLGVDMGNFAKVDQFEVYVRDAGGAFVRSGGDVTWTAWSSINGTQWTPLHATSLFDTTLSRYVVTFDPATARYFKVVNFNVNVISTFVTEIVPLVHGVIAGGGDRVTSAFGNTAALNLQARLSDKLYGSYSGSLSNTAQSSPSSSLAGWNHAHSVTVSVKLASPLNLVASGDYREMRVSDNPTLRSLGSSAGLQFIPIPRASITASGFATLETYAANQVETEGAQVSTSGSPLETLQLSVNTSVGRANANGDLSTFVSGTGAVSAKVLPDLNVSLTAIFSRIVAGTFDIAADVPITRIQDIQSYSGSVTYQPSQQLFLQGHVGYFQAGTISGMSEGAILGWTPFPNGPLTIRTSYAHDLDVTTGIVSQRMRVDAGWALSRYLALNASYQDQRSSGGPSGEVIFLTLAARI